MELRVGIKRAIFTNTARTKIGDLFFAVMPVPCTRTFKYTNTSLKSADLIRVGECVRKYLRKKRHYVKKRGATGTHNRVLSYKHRTKCYGFTTDRSSVCISNTRNAVPFLFLLHIHVHLFDYHSAQLSHVGRRHPIRRVDEKSAGELRAFFYLQLIVFH